MSVSVCVFVRVCVVGWGGALPTIDPLEVNAGPSSPRAHLATILPSLVERGSRKSHCVP